MTNLTIDGVGFNVEHLSGFSQDDFVKEFSTAAMKEAVWPDVKGRGDKLIEAYKMIRKSANVEDEPATEPPTPFVVPAAAIPKPPVKEGGKK